MDVCSAAEDSVSTTQDGFRPSKVPTSSAAKEQLANCLTCLLVDVTTESFKSETLTYSEEEEDVSLKQLVAFTQT